MDRERAKELLPVITAFAEGKDIEWRGCPSLRGSDDEWATMPTNPLLITTFPADDYEYRIKPKPREWWLDPTDGEILQQDTPPNSDFIKVREVLS